MKKTFSILTVAALTLSLAACSANSTNNTSAESSTSSVSSNMVTFFDSDGETILKKEEVSSAQDILNYLPEKSGKVFVGWFVKPDYSRRFSANSEMTKNLKLYAGFSSYEDDKREFIVVGNGESDALKASNWGANVTDELKLTKEGTDGSNLYSITLKLNKGDEFQFAINGSWENQRGFGYLEEVSIDGVSYLENSGGLGETSSKRSNIKVAKSGTYKFTLETYPADDTYDTTNSEYTEEKKESFNINNFDKITWTYTEQ